MNSLFNHMQDNSRKLTKNEKEVICCLLDDARMPDIKIAEKLRITTQAVGKIRKKLENDRIIEGYRASVNLDRIGIHSFAIAMIRAKPVLWKKSIDDIKKVFNSAPNLICLCRVTRSDTCLIAMFGFRNTQDLEDYFHIMQQNDNFEVREIFTFSSKSILKLDFSNLVRCVLRKPNHALKTMNLEQ